MTDHCLGTERIAHSSHAVMEHIASRWKARGHRRAKYMPKPSTYTPRINRRFLKVEKQPSVLVEVSNRRLDIDHLLHDLHPRKAPGAKTIWDRYVMWCEARGRRGIYSRCLARRFLKSLKTNRL